MIVVLLGCVVYGRGDGSGSGVVVSGCNVVGVVLSGS